MVHRGHGIARAISALRALFKMGVKLVGGRNVINLLAAVSKFTLSFIRKKKHIKSSLKFLCHTLMESMRLILVRAGQRGSYVKPMNHFWS